MLAKAHQRSDGRGVGRALGVLVAAVLIAVPLSTVGSAEASAADPIRTVLAAVTQTASTQVPSVAGAAATTPAGQVASTTQSTSAGASTAPEASTTAPAPVKTASPVHQGVDARPTGITDEPAAPSPAALSDLAPRRDGVQGADAPVGPGGPSRQTGSTAPPAIVRQATIAQAVAQAVAQTTPAVVQERTRAITGKAASTLAAALADAKATSRATDAIGAITSASRVVRSLATHAPAVGAVLSDLSTTADTIVAAIGSIAQPTIAELQPLGVPDETQFVAADAVPTRQRAAADAVRTRQTAGPLPLAGRTSAPPSALAPVATATADEAGRSGLSEMPTAASEPHPSLAPIAMPHSAPLIASGKGPASRDGVPAVPPKGYASVAIGAQSGPSHAEQHSPFTAPAAVRRTSSSPDGVSTTASAGGGGGVALALSLAALLMLAAPSILRRLGLAAEPWRLAPLMLIADRPG